MTRLKRIGLGSTRTRRRKNREIAVGAADQPVMLVKPRIDIGDALAAMDDACLAGQAALDHTDMIVEFDLKRCAPQIVAEQAGQRATHRRIRQRISHAAMRRVLRAEMLLRIDVDRHHALAGGALDQLQAERAGEGEIRRILLHRSATAQRTRVPPNGGGGGGRRVPRGSCAWKARPQCSTQ